MAVNRIQTDILSILIEEKTYVKTDELRRKIEKHAVSPRHFQMEMKKLIDSRRVSIRGQASLTEYILQEIQRSYPGCQFLYVCKNNLVVGLLFKVKGIYRFYYDSGYLAQYDVPIPTIPLQIDPVDFVQIPAVFEDNFPEGVNREIFETAHKIADEFDMLPLLEDSVGDICFTRTADACNMTDRTATGYLNSLGEILGSNRPIEVLEGYEILMEEEELFPESQDLSTLKSLRTEGISGFQYKRFVNIDEASRQIVKSDGAGEYILKPYSRFKANPESEFYFPHLAVNEHLHISFAKNELGFNAPRSAIVKTDRDEEYHYIVKRFDRLHQTRFAKATFGVFLGLRAENKYDTTSEKMFTRIAKELLSPKERMALLKYYAYSVIIVHEDLHTKNLSVIFDGEKVLLAPLYDMSATGFYPHVKGYESHLPINGKQTNIRPNDFRGVCRILEIDFKEFKKEALWIARCYETVMPKYFDALAALGPLPYCDKKEKRTSGEVGKSKTVFGETMEFADVLRRFHAERVRRLYELGWLETE